MPTPNSSKANFISLADSDPTLVDGNWPSACNEPFETNNLKGTALSSQLANLRLPGQLSTLPWTPTPLRL
ncbi:hypothetical protein Nepgr_017375 [Nepenthes gracilis]|uniref:Uncharacterized protein n=1 Tax=Nepenthes gracilis TaxID=150966 RepID=A0AAD3SRI5_NEPGR|nr:hypothetical protein Nepgr_017375 [Nepenthes gracilis]